MPTDIIQTILHEGHLFNLGKNKRSMSLRVYTHSQPVAYMLTRRFGGSMTRHMRHKAINSWAWSLSKRQGLLMVYQALPPIDEDTPEFVFRLKKYLENFSLLPTEEVVLKDKHTP